MFRRLEITPPSSDHGEENVGGKPKPLLFYLLSRFAITPEEYEDIISMKTSYDQMTELILILMRKPEEDYNTLCDGLCQMVGIVMQIPGLGLEISRTLLNVKTLGAS